MPVPYMGSVGIEPRGRQKDGRTLRYVRGITGELVVLIAEPQENLLRGLKTLLRQLFFQPLLLLVL